MAEIATIARPYAEALFKASAADPAATTAWVETLGVMAANDSLLHYAEHPKVTVEQVLELLSDSYAQIAAAALPPMAANFLRTVVEAGRLAALPQVAAQYRALANAHAGCSDAVVYSAFAMDAAALDDVSGTLERRFGRKLQLSVVLEPALIGGIRVVVGDEVLDTSVKARLEHMKVALSA